jgi:nitrite reductase/ring-hydroxylating ferredoxin subunit
VHAQQVIIPGPRTRPHLHDSKPSPEPLWRDEFSVFSSDEKYVSRRQFSKFLVLTSMGMFVGNLWILVRSWFSRKPFYPVTAIASAGEIPIGGVKLFPYPNLQEQCILLRTGTDTYVAYSQKCTHLSCAVFYSASKDRFECPCHNGAFSVQDGSPLQGPPRRPLPRVVLARKGDALFATGIHLEG